MAKLIFCEDNPLIQKLIAATLRGSDHDVRIVADGLEGLAVIEQDPPDAVFTDLAMPGMDGFQLCSEIKSRPALAHIPVVVVSASAQRHQIAEAYRRGAVDYLAKPFSTAALRAKVEEVLAHHCHRPPVIPNAREESPASGNSPRHSEPP